MKITILDENSIEGAIAKLTDFLETQYPEAIINGNMIVYVSLKGEKEDNRKDFTVYADGSVSSSEGETNRIRREVSDEYRKKWEQYMDDLDYKIKRLEYRIKGHENYIKTAKENLRDPQKVADRKDILKMHQEQLAELMDHYRMATALKHAKRISWFRNATADRKMYWIFWYYETPVYFDGSTLEKGFPEFFSESDELKARQIYETKYKLL